MKNPKCLLILLSLVFTLAFLNISVSGQSADDKSKIASAAATGDGVRFEISVAYSTATLTVSAPNGKVYRKEFKSGTAPTFQLLDKRGNKLPDGQYVYELRLSPSLSAELRKEMAASRDKDEDTADDVEGRVRAALPAHPLVQSGAFSAHGGVITVAGGVEQETRPAAKVGVGRDLPEAKGYLQEGAFFVEAVASKPTARSFVRGVPHAVMPDDVIPDDLIVQGSACVGLDCVSGEVFGFDTVRLKENNTRLQFDDTSSSAGFPTNNWQIRANSSDSGGASFLGFVDQGASGNSETGTLVLSVAAGAPANSIKVDSSGRLGIKTATPVLDVHAANSNTPAIRLEQNNSGGFTAQTWDMGGNEANFFVRDITGGSLLPFRIRPGAPTSSVDINADGKVGVGTASPSHHLHVKGSAIQTIAVESITNGNNAQFSFIGKTAGGTAQTWLLGENLATTAGAFEIHDSTAAQTRLLINTSGNIGIGTNAPTDTLSVNGTASKPGGGTWAVFSDERLKNLKGNFTSGLSAVMQLQPLRYEYRRDNALGIKSDVEHVGFGAQAVQKVIPEAVTRNANGYLMVNSDPILWTMLNAIKEQQKEIEQLKAQVKRLQSRRRR